MHDWSKSNLSVICFQRMKWDSAQACSHNGGERIVSNFPAVLTSFILFLRVLQTGNGFYFMTKFNVLSECSTGIKATGIFCSDTKKKTKFVFLGKFQILILKMLPLIRTVRTMPLQTDRLFVVISEYSKLSHWD